jgi:alpha-ketoglutarate-dependent taurine dioxygenase
MILVNTTEFTSIEEIKSNPDKYKEIYLRDKIIVFRNANLNKEQQTELMEFFGDTFGWYPNSLDARPSDYIEDHHKHMVGGRYAAKNELMLNWHTEHVQNEGDSFHGATWRMEKFNCPDDSGHTYFVDMTKMFNDLSIEDQEFASKCVSQIEIRESTYSPEGVQTIKEAKQSFKMVRPHPITGEKTLRVFLGSEYPENIYLNEFDGREPIKEEKDNHLRLVKQICKDVWQNEDIRMIHKWQEGDLAVPDLFKLAHAVSGGFVENQRTLQGQFGKANPWIRG